MQIDNRNFCAIIDTGAQASLISQEAVDKIDNNTIHKSNIQITGLDGKTSPIQGEVDIKFKIHSNKKVFSNKFLIVNNS